MSLLLSIETQRFKYQINKKALTNFLKNKPKKLKLMLKLKSLVCKI